MLNTIMNVVGWAGTLLVFAGVAIRGAVAFGRLNPRWEQYAYWTAITGLVLVVVYTLSQWREIARSFQKRETKFGAMTTISIIAVLAIIVGLNYLVGRRDKRWDLTAGQSFTLSDQTTKILNSLKSPVKVLVFERPQETGRFRDSLASYEFATKNVQVEYIDPDRNPARVKEYGVLNYGTVVLEYEGRRENVMSEREQELTNGLVKVMSGRQVKAYFVEGHGEKSSTSNDRNGYANVLDLLKRDNYTVDKIVLAQTQGGVPADTSVLIVAGPTADFLPPEVDAIRTYLRKGGRVLFLVDPPMGENVRPVPTLEGLLKEYGVTFGHDVVIDISGMGQLLGTDASVPVVSKYSPHPVTQNFTLLTAFPFAQSVKGVADTSMGPSANTQNVLQTSERSWSESDVKSLSAGGKVSLDEASGDHKGPVTIALSLSIDAPDAPAPPAPAAGAEAPPKVQTRFIVVGDSDFATNAASGIQGNGDLFVNMNNWLTQQENLISIRPRDTGDRRVTLTADQQRMIGYLSLLFIPGIILGTGVLTWWQRR